MIHNPIEELSMGDKTIPDSRHTIPEYKKLKITGINKKRQQYPCFLIKDEQEEVTHVVIQNTDTKDKLIYKVEHISFEELEEIIK